MWDLNSWLRILMIFVFVMFSLFVNVSVFGICWVLDMVFFMCFLKKYSFVFWVMVWLMVSLIM